MSQMTDPQTFSSAAPSWHDFYLLCGGAAATLAGLMFVAVTFGASLVNDENAATMRAFVDPPLFHFMHVITTACVFVMPSMSPTVFGALILAGAGARSLGLAWVYRHYRRAHKERGDMEASDWLIGIVLPGISFALLMLGGIGLLVGLGPSLTIVAGATLAVLIIGMRSAWELMLWLVAEVGRRDKSP